MSLSGQCQQISIWWESNNVHIHPKLKHIQEENGADQVSTVDVKENGDEALVLKGIA
jgi:hypothetical protein